jgi:hypothetical protein
LETGAPASLHDRKSPPPGKALREDAEITAQDGGIVSWNANEWAAITAVSFAEPACYVFQPYGLELETLAELVFFAKTHGLELTLSSFPSWHFPGAVLTVELRPAPGLPLP